MREDEWWATKIVTLLHDVPWKPWVVRMAFNGVGRVISKPREGSKVAGIGFEECREFIINHDSLSKLRPSSELKANDWEAIALLEIIARTLEGQGRSEAAELLRKAVRDRWSVTHEADVTASTLDRLLASFIESPKKLVFLNIFNPGKVLEVANPDPNDVCRFIGELVSLVKVVSQASNASDRDALRLLYFILYTMLEPLWYRSVKGKRAVPPADTRIPHHTVFDHLHATVMALNMVKRRWALVRVDIPGIQAFVGRGRKTRDMWAGSWLISYLAWRSVEPLIRRFGPDIVVSPALSLNPFYIYVVMSELRERGIHADKVELPKIAWRNDWPDQPLMPATVTLLLPLPSDSGSDDYVSSVWKSLGSEMGVEACNELPKIESGVNDVVISDCIRGIAERGLKDTMSAISDTVSKIMEESGLLREGALGVIGGQVGGDEVVEVFRKYLISTLRVPPVTVRVYSVSSMDVSREVANLYGRHRDVFERLKEVSKRIGAGGLAGPWRVIMFHVAMTELARREEQLANISVTPAFQAAEPASVFTQELYRRRLRSRCCSVCGELPAVVRAPRGSDYDNMFTERIKDLDGGISVKYLIDEGEALCPYCLLRRLMARYPRLVISGRERYRRELLLSTCDLASIWHLLNIAKTLKPVTVGRPLRVRAFSNFIEGLRLLQRIPPESREKLVSVAEEWVRLVGGILMEGVERLGGRLKVPLYLAYVKGDADFVGKGYWRGRLGLSPEEYVERILKSVGVEDSAVVGEVTRVIADFMNAFKEAGIVPKDATTILTPAYAYTLSRSLMIASLIDSIIVESLGGVLVYAGGDDVLALVPVKASALKLGGRVGEGVLPPILSVAVGLSQVMPVSVDDLYKGIAELVGADEAEDLDVALVMVTLSRLCYGGGLGRVEGFHLMREVVTGAPIAYGRTYGVYYAHFKDPMWSSFKAALELEEMKDHISVASRGLIHSKDSVVLGYGRGSLYQVTRDASIIPFALNGYRRCLSGTTSMGRGMVCVLRDVLRVRGLITARRISRSLVYDAEEPLMLNIVRRSLNPPSALVIKGVMRRLVGRNIVDEGIRAEVVSIIEGLSDYVCNTRLGGQAPLPLALHALRAVRFSLSASRLRE